MAAGPAVTLYRRDGCPLCDEAEQLLQALALELGFSIEQVDIECDDALHRRYLLEIPVVAVGAREVARAPIWPAALREALQEAFARE